MAVGTGTARRANRHRGEVEATIGGEVRILCLTLGALAELEAAFAVDDLQGLAARFSSGRLKAADMIRVIGAGLRGGGNVFSDEDVAGLDFEGGVAGCAAIVGRLLEATFAQAAREMPPVP
ncbi:gene transfer agent family protein [Rhizobiaceae bacterium n13]|uniref:Gene transfer agent family protein n=1 Tax=Ferirhizobium litorale TaxID=2927786 RepID=A0AAE3QDU1_9HYPH|nr:gene transfer agent family protein [Fererhizobium litorale]MDI7861261.1 gene transfer agent family protein [Fererhizobium litorale]MDI7921408.1 gene transfer agent family protein [Fererhizobium litorale]